MSCATAWRLFLPDSPRPVAPNLLTLIGLLFIVGALSVQLAFTPNLDGPAPNWTYVL